MHHRLSKQISSSLLWQCDDAKSCKWCLSYNTFSVCVSVCVVAVVCAKWTYDYFEVVTGDDGVSVLDPLDGGSWGTGHLTLKDDVHGLVGVNVGRPLHELGRNCGNQVRQRSQWRLKKMTKAHHIDIQCWVKWATGEGIQDGWKIIVGVIFPGNQFVKTGQAHQTSALWPLLGNEQNKTLTNCQLREGVKNSKQPQLRTTYPIIFGSPQTTVTFTADGNALNSW